MEENTKISFLQNIRNNLEFYKKQQWIISYYNLLLQAGIVSLNVILLQFEIELDILEKIIISIISFLIAAITTIIILFLNESILKAQKYANNVYNDNDLKTIKYYYLDGKVQESLGNKVIIITLSLINFISPIGIIYFFIKTYKI